MRHLNKRILILCEGTTEYLYAKSLQSELPREKRRYLSIEIGQSQQNDPMSMVTEARKKAKTAQKDRNPYDDIWLFFDHDNWPQLQSAFATSAKEGFRIAFSAICIEHWFILHFEDCGKSFTRGQEALDHLKKIWGQYHKTKLNHYAELKGLLPNALKRAAIINNAYENGNLDSGKNPFFTIPDFVAYFEELKL